MKKHCCWILNKPICCTFKNQVRTVIIWCANRVGMFAWKVSSIQENYCSNLILESREPGLVAWVDEVRDKVLRIDWVHFWADINLVLHYGWNSCCYIICFLLFVCINGWKCLQLLSSISSFFFKSLFLDIGLSLCTVDQFSFIVNKIIRHL